MSARREQALPAALEQAVLGEVEPFTRSNLLRLQRLRAAWPAVRRELLAEAEKDLAAAQDARDVWRANCLATRRQRDRLLAEAEPEHWAAKEPGLADHYRALADAACDAVDLDADADDLAPTDLRTSIYERISEASQPEPAVAERVEAAVRKGLSIFAGIPEPEVRAAILFSLRRLHFGAVAGEIRARRALEDFERRSSADGECRVIVRPTPSTFGSCGAPVGGDHRADCPFAALAADPPDAALAELLGLPGKWEERSNDHAREALGKQFEFCAYEDQAAQHWDQAADELRAVLSKLGLAAGEGVGDG